jgi:4-diphosphocytidyl-2-C-methyl-D-erythritol kinase
MITMLAPAKLNLVLEVLGKRDDGYHEIRSLVQAISLSDVLYFEIANDISLECTETALQTQDNLVIQAAELLKITYDFKKGVKITLKKQIPWSAGLAGGSSDAAATLLALNKLWKLKLKVQDLLAIAAQLGSDVPFFIQKGTALVEGRGEKITPMPVLTTPSWFILFMPQFPQISHKTKLAYSKLNSQHFTDGQITSKAIEAWDSKQGIRPALLFNVFDRIALDTFLGLRDYWNGLEQAGLTNIHLAGSGPTLFAPVTSKNNAAKLYQQLKDIGFTAYPVSSVINPGN